MATAAPSTSTVAPPAANTQKRDYLISLEANAQARWAKENMFEVNSPYTDGQELIPTSDFGADAARVRGEKPKWFGTFPYPVRRGCSTTM